MEKDRGTKMIALIALVVASISLSIGFALFSKDLTIDSQARYEPANKTLNVSFSTEKTSIKMGTITPTGTAANGSVTLTQTGDSVATISGLNAKFTDIDQSAIYNLFIYNNSDYTAKLNSATMSIVSGDKKIVCTPVSGTNNTLVQNACSDISLIIKDLDNSVTIFDTNGSFNAHSIDSKKGVSIEIELKYNSGHTIPDGDFDVQFGTLTLNYTS